MKKEDDQSATQNFQNSLADLAKNMSQNMSEASENPLAVYRQTLDLWGEMLSPIAKAGQDKVNAKDRRFSDPKWQHPVFDLVRQSYGIMSDYMIGAAEQMEGLAPEDHEKLKFAVNMLVDAMSPANSPLTNPVALEKAIETKGESLQKGMGNLMRDIQRGQITHTDPDAFEPGENIAMTPGKVVHQDPLFQLIQYTPSTKEVARIPLLIFPPWINRFYILDLTAQKSFVKWCVDQGITVFMVSWKSADKSMADIVWDDYIQAQINAIDIVRDLLDVPSVNAIGYCVAGTTLAATLSILHAQEREHIVESATFFTAQIDFSEGGDLLNFVDDNQFAIIDAMKSDGYTDGRLLAFTFNLLRGNDLIWSTVVKNHLMGEDYPEFDLLYWNGDVTNLPSKWHGQYLRDLYRDNLLVEPGRLSALDTPINLTTVKTPTYIQAGIKDHISPANSVWKMQDHFTGPIKFVLAGSGHIAGVVNPPADKKYQYWLNDDKKATSFDAFQAGATEIPGSWWPDWREWYEGHSGGKVKSTGARQPGKGKLKAIEDAPGSYVKTQ